VVDAFEPHRVSPSGSCMHNYSEERRRGKPA
jgi:hypothetical protein